MLSVSSGTVVRVFVRVCTPTVAAPSLLGGGCG